MKIVHINTSDTGGAGIAARNIHHALETLGIDSHMLVRWHRTNDDTITQAQPNQDQYIPSKNSLLRKAEKVLRRRGKMLTTVEKYQHEMDRLDMLYGAAYTMPVSQYDITTHPLVQEADIIHLHWVENFIDYPTFFQKITKPVVWTFHDENIAYGGFHYSDEARNLKEPFSEIENQFFRIKKTALQADLNIHMVALSKQMEQFYHYHGLQPCYPISNIHNGIHPNDFQILDRNICRKILGIPNDRTVLCFCASDIHEKRKGLDTLIKALETINNSKISLLCVGTGELPKSSVSIVGTGAIENTRFLSIAYSASDLFVMPSYLEAFGQTPVEAMYCGCPVVAFPCGIINELITPLNGVRCSDFCIETLATSIQNALNTQYNRENIREDIIKRFSISKIAGQYIDLYKRILCR